MLNPTPYRVGLWLFILRESDATQVQIMSVHNSQDDNKHYYFC